MIVVLGCAVVGRYPSKALAYRLARALDLWEKFVAGGATNTALPLVVVCGGQGPDEIAHEADVMADWLIAHGVPAGRIVRERDSTSTEENLKFAAQLLRERQFVPVTDSERIEAYVVTSSPHLPRSLYWALRAGFKPHGRGARVPDGSVPRAIAWEIAATFLKPPVKLYGYLRARARRG